MQISGESGYNYNVCGQLNKNYGAVAQLGERDIRIVEADGSIPFSSTEFRIEKIFGGSAKKIAVKRQFFRFD